MCRYDKMSVNVAVYRSKLIQIYTTYLFISWYVINIY